jgi:hypothetical protein
MRGRTIGFVPVLDGERLVGIVTISDPLVCSTRSDGGSIGRPRRYGAWRRIVYLIESSIGQQAPGEPS